jgi:hypothetical protein
MKTVLSDGRIFETLPFLNIVCNDNDPVYKFEFETSDRTVKSSARHLWAVWDRERNDIDMIRMDTIDICRHELLIQGWE